MKLRDMMFLVIGGLLVISGMVLNALISGNVEAQDAMGNGYFNKIICKNLMIYGDDGETIVAYLGVNEDGEMMFQLQSKSKTDDKSITMEIDENGGRFNSYNKMGESVVRIGVRTNGGGSVLVNDKFGNVKKQLR